MESFIGGRVHSDFELAPVAFHMVQIEPPWLCQAAETCKVAPCPQRTFRGSAAFHHARSASALADQKMGQQPSGRCSSTLSSWRWEGVLL